MSIFDVFSFKKEAAKIFTKENFSSILDLAKDKIIEQAKETIAGFEKKAIVDAFIIAKIKEICSKCNNKIVLWVVEQIINAVPVITQAVYSFLKERVENL